MTPCRVSTVLLLILACLSAGACDDDPVEPAPGTMDGILFTKAASWSLRHQRDVLIIGDDGSMAGHPVEATEVFMARWSPDGDRVAYTRREYDGGWGLHLVDPDGGDAVALAQDPGMSSMFAWSPDGDRIVYAGARMDDSDPGNALYAVPVTGGEPEVLAICPAGSECSWPAWSPDGSRIATLAGTGGRINIVEFGVHDTVSLRPLEIGLPGTSLAPAWSPDGSSLAIGACGAEVDSRLMDCGIYILGLQGNIQDRLIFTYDCPGEDACEMLVAQPSFSPDGSRIAMYGEFLEQAGSGLEARNGIFIVDLANGEARPVYTTGDRWVHLPAPDWR